VGLLIATPAAAQSWWGWLDNLSGPGPFWGLDFDIRLVCAMERQRLPETMAEIQLASRFLTTLTPLLPTDNDKEKARSFVATLDGLGANLAKISGTDRTKIGADLEA